MIHSPDIVYNINVSEIEIDLLNNSRRIFHPETCRELALDIEENTLLVPILLMEQPDKQRPYKLVAGHRRITAVGLLGHKTIRSLFSDVDSAQAVEINLAENLSRVDLDIEQEVSLVCDLMQSGKTSEEVASFCKKHKKWVTDRLTINKLPSDLKALVFSENISITNALDIARETGRSFGTEKFEEIIIREKKRLGTVKTRRVSRNSKKTRHTKKYLERCQNFFLFQPEKLEDVILTIGWVAGTITTEDYLVELASLHPEMDLAYFPAVNDPLYKERKM